MAGKANRGKELERLIEASLSKRSLYWQRNYPPTRYIPVGGRLQAVPAGEGPPDFLVAFRRLAWLFEAKSFKGSRWQFSSMPKHQADALDLLDAQEGPVVSGVVLGQMDAADKLVQAWWVKWTALGPLWRSWHLGMAAHGDAGVGIGQLDSIGIRLEGADFVAGVLDSQA